MKSLIYASARDAAWPRGIFPCVARLASLALPCLLALACRGADVTPTGTGPEPPAEPTQPTPPVEPAPPPISDDPVIQAIVALAAADSQVDDHLAALAVEIGPRLTGTPQLTEAELWAVDQFESWGLTTTREQWGEFPVVFERGKASGEVIRPSRRELEIGTHAWTPGTRGQDGLEAGAPVRGQALRYPSDVASLRASKPYLRGAWIMIPHEFDRPPKQLREQIERAFDQAPIAGLVHAAGASDDTRIETHGRHELEPKNLPTRVEIRLRGDQHHELLTQMDSGVYVELEFGVANRLLPGPVPVFNVIAELPGAELPNERVVIGAHLDSWDGASGAIDNATGVATTMEAARLLAAACARAQVQPRRSLSFQLWTGEEQGLLGSLAWVRAHPELLAGISAVLVHDEGTNYLAGLSVTPEQHAIMSTVFDPVQKLAPQTMPFALELVEGLPFEPSDSTSFLRAGVPAFFWAQAGRSDYERYHHTQYDHADAVIDEYQRHSALVVAIAAWQLAEATERLDRSNLHPLPRRVLGVELDETTIVAVADDSVARRSGLQTGDRILSIDGTALASDDEVIAAIQRGEASKTAVLERRLHHDATERVELILDWSSDPDEAARAARRAERRERFGPELRPWDTEERGTEVVHD
jgi:carboxypeptidase Q